MGLGLSSFMAVETSPGLGFLLQTPSEEKAKSGGVAERNDLLEVLLHLLFSDPPPPNLGQYSGTTPITQGSLEVCVPVGP